MIPDSWELPSYEAGSVYDMTGWRERRGPLPAQPEGNEAEVRRFPQGRKAKPKPAPPAQAPASDWGAMGRGLADIEPYDPAKHLGPPELQHQGDLDSLEAAGFEPHDHSAWFRDSGDGTGKGHYIFHVPGHRVNGELKPWHVSSDPESVSTPMKSARGAIAFADRENNQRMAAFPDWTKVR